MELNGLTQAARTQSIAEQVAANKPETDAAVKKADEKAKISKANYKTNTGRDFGSDPRDWCQAPTAKSGDSGGGGSNPLSILSTAVSFISNPIGTGISLLTGKSKLG